VGFGLGLGRRLEGGQHIVEVLKIRPAEDSRFEASSISLEKMLRSWFFFLSTPALSCLILLHLLCPDCTATLVLNCEHLVHT
jgi:hypothetical protein